MYDLDPPLLLSRSLIESILNGTTCPPTSTRCGWVSQGNGRGTLDIIFSCGSALFICLWLMLHLNVPALEDGWWQVCWRKARWLALGLLTPEVLLLLAVGQWTSAKRSFRDMRALGHEQWSMTHAFYADSGGFVVKLLDNVSFPVTAKQLCYLIEEGYLKEPPQISKEEIDDKSKADVFAKTIAALQLGWLVLQLTARAIQHLPITPLELSTVAVVACTASTYFFWLRKPPDVELPTMLEIDITTADTLLRAGDAVRTPWVHTPLDFVDGEAHIILITFVSKERTLPSSERRPMTRIHNDRNPRFDSFYQRALLAFVVATFSTIHFAEWNFSFPSRAEQIIWRTCCIVAEVSLGLQGVHETMQYLFDPEYQQRPYLQRRKTVWPENLLFLILSGLYFLARVVLLGSVILSMRSLPNAAFATVNWTAFVPHF
ncbi:MAG: hypothetical protein MMC33_010317 [Icmadophila ericetorum]|nr:hypothetical protein [Icmadophila ericetorum]